MPHSLAELALRMHESVDFTDQKEVKKYIGFTRIGENLIGIRKRATKLMEEDALEIGPGGIVTPRRDPLGLYIIYGGTPHHTCNLFGYWHINDVDEVYVTIGGKNPEDEATRLLMMRYPNPGERDMFSWYCRECVTLLYCFVHPTGDLGFETFWRAESEAVTTFNSDPKLRRCPNCGAEHPLGYRFMANKNSAAEEVARQTW